MVNDSSIIRNRIKIVAVIENSKRLLEVRKEYGSFHNYIWQFSKHKKINEIKSISQIPTRSKESDAMSVDMKKRGFKFCGTTICYAFMQTVGMVNDHEITCFRHKELNGIKKK